MPYLQTITFVVGLALGAWAIVILRRNERERLRRAEQRLMGMWVMRQPPLKPDQLPAAALRRIDEELNGWFSEVID